MRVGYPLWPVSSVAARQRYDAAVHNPFLASSTSYDVQRQGDRVFHKENHRNPLGKVSIEARLEVHYVIRSGKPNH